MSTNVQTVKRAAPYFRKCEYILVNGILTRLGGIKGWTKQAELIYSHLGVSAISYGYECGALTRFIGQGARTRELTEMCTEIEIPRIFVGHSNGGELFSRMMRESDLEFQAAHLFAPAVNADFDKNGFNKALLEGRLKTLYLYGSTKDVTLRNGNFLTGWMEFAGLGYGDLGYAGAQNVHPLVRSQVINDGWNNEFEHSDWWKPENMHNSISLTLRK